MAAFLCKICSYFGFYLHLSLELACALFCVMKVKCCNLYRITFDQHDSALGYPGTCEDNVIVLPVCGSHGP